VKNRISSFLPAWRADTQIDLLADQRLGVVAAMAGLERLVDPLYGPIEPESQQIATARYGARGFSAAAVTAMEAPGSALMVATYMGVRRDAIVRFQHPYAVVAVVNDPDSPWFGLPVFTGWVAEAVEPD